jgi:hypothetical protein
MKTLCLALTLLLSQIPLALAADGLVHHSETRSATSGTNDACSGAKSSANNVETICIKDEERGRPLNITTGACDCKTGTSQVCSVTVEWDCNRK